MVYKIAGKSFEVLYRSGGRFENVNDTKLLLVRHQLIINDTNFNFVEPTFIHFNVETILFVSHRRFLGYYPSRTR